MSNGIVMVEIIPAEYREALVGLAQGPNLVAAEVVLTFETEAGTTFTRTNTDVVVELCVDCLNHCASELSDEERDTLLAGKCVDNSGNDDRVCIDPDC